MSVPSILHAFVGDPVAADAYGNASEVLRAGWRPLRQLQSARLRRGSGTMAKFEDATGQRFSARCLGDPHD